MDHSSRFAADGEGDGREGAGMVVTVKRVGGGGRGNGGQQKRVSERPTARAEPPGQRPFERDRETERQR